MVKKESENLKKLRQISLELENRSFEFNINEESNQYKILTDKIDSLVHEELKKMDTEKDSNNKLQCYETLFTSIVFLLEGVKQVV